jgi:hypothetical protein
MGGDKVVSLVNGGKLLIPWLGKRGHLLVFALLLALRKLGGVPFFNRSEGFGEDFRGLVGAELF